MFRILRNVLLASLILGAAAWAHVRLQHPTNGNKLRWSSPSTIGIVIQSTGSADVTDGSHATALRNAIAAWNDCVGTSATLVENVSAVQQARTDWEADDIHLILFDETDTSGYFPGSSGVVAVTPVWFASNGVIVDADILFNGFEFQFTTQADPGSFDIQDVGAHELGHLLGLDHSGWAGATMYPYVDPASILHRSVSLDDERGLRDAYPSGSFASITGTVRRVSDNSVVAGASVSCRDSFGSSAANALSNDSGIVTLKGLAPETYTIFASPLDSPVSSGNLGAGSTIETDFESTEFVSLEVGGGFTVIAGQSLSAGDLLVEDDVAIGLGTSTDDFPARCISGATASLVLHGTGLAPGSTLVASDPDLTVNPTSWLNGQVNFQVTVPPGTAPGHVDLIATNNSNERSILPAALEITPANPVVTTVSPTIGSRNGGTALTLTGSNFTAGSRVIVGKQIYIDGAMGGATVVDVNTITLTTQATTSGMYDVVVIGGTGVEGRKVSGYQFRPIPTIQARFPATGTALGGTPLVITGSDFDPAIVVRIDGVAQTQVTVQGTTRIDVITDAGVPGPYVLEIENPGGDIASSAFVYVAAPDPAINMLTPASGSSSGGSTITIAGANFAAPLDVYFGADPDTGLGGTLASSVTVVDPSTLEVVTPAHASGMTTVLVQAANGQAALIANAFTFQGGGGGGGCSIQPHGDSGGPFEPLAGAAWILIAAVWLALRSRGARQRA